jgi:LPS sulfotransferase NodH
MPLPPRAPRSTPTQRPQDLLRGHLAATKAYAAARVLPAPDVARFVILTAGRAGSELLVSLLDAHSEIQCDSEWWTRPRRDPEALIRGRSALAGWRGRKAYGFKVLAGHLDQLPGPAGRDDHLRRMAADGWLVVHLRRRNVLHQAVSARRAALTQYHYRAGTAPPFVPMRVDVSAVLSLAAHLEALDARHDRLLVGVDAFELTYEDDLEQRPDQVRTVARLCALVGVTPEATTTDVVRVHPPLLEQMLLNYPELAGAAAGTRWATHLDPVTA